MKVRVEEQLNLSEDQKSKIEKLRLEHLRETKDLRNQLEIKRAELNAAMTSDQPDKKQVNSLVSEINSLRSDRFEQKINHQMQVRELLDDEQKLRFDQMKDRTKRHLRGRRY